MKFKIFFIALIVVCGVLFFTNPKEENHKEFIKEKFITVFNQKLDSEVSKYNSSGLSLVKNLGASLLPALGDKYLDKLTNSHVKINNYYLFSTTQVLYKNEWHTIGYGVFNKVKLFPQVEKEIEKIDLKKELPNVLKDN